MQKTTRRNLLKAAAIGGATATGLSGVFAAEQKPDNGSEHAHDNRPLTDKRANTVVTFGQWDADNERPFDRQPINSDRTRNIHRLLPFEAEVDAGGAVSFVISGVHQVLIYHEREFAELKAAWEAAGSPVIAGPPVALVNFPDDRVYRGLDPRVLQYLPVGTLANQVTDRVESVNFKNPGRYLVTCGVMPHFVEGMHGYVNVKA
jgi:plastocyanin